MIVDKQYRMNGVKVGTTSAWPVTSHVLDSLCCQLKGVSLVYHCYCALFTIGQYVLLSVSKACLLNS